MKVCHICFSFSIGGIENLLVDIMNEQSSKAQVSLVIVNKRYNSEILARLSSSVAIILINRPEGNRWNFTYILKLWLIILRIRPCVIHCHTHNLINILLPFKRKCVYTIHQVNIPLKYLTKYRKLFSISNAVKNDLINRGNLSSILIYNGIDFSKFLKTGSYETGDCLRIIQIGRLMAEQKGQDISIKSVYHLIHQYHLRNIKLDIVGDGPSQVLLEDLINSLGLGGYVTLLGPRDREWIYNNLCRYHLLIQPSRSEGFGLTVIEAVASGLPLIASDIDGLSEILKDVPCALLFPSNDVQELAIRINEVISEYTQNLIFEKCTVSLNLIKNRFSVVSTANNYIDQYATLVDGTN